MDYGTKTNVVAALLIAAAVTVAGATAQQFRIDWFTVDNGGATRSSTGGFELDDCNSDGGVNLYDYADFEFCLAGPRTEPPDRSCLCFDQDGDRDVDHVDFTVLSDCMSDPIGGTLEPPCDCADLNLDGRVDLLDYAWFQNAFTDEQ